MDYEYLYIYRDENTVIQLWKKSEYVYVLSNGWENINFDLSEKRNAQALKGLKEGRKKVWVSAEDDYEYEVYTSANAAFGLDE